MSAGAPAVRPWGEKSFYADDPWGNPLCFVEQGTLYQGWGVGLARRRR